MRRQDAPDRNGPFWSSFFADVKAEVDWKRIEVRKGFAYYLPEGVEGKKNLVFVRNGLDLWGDTKRPLRAVTGICDGITEKRICLQY